MNNKSIILAARTVSMAFTPFYLPLLGVFILFFFSYVSIFPWQFKLIMATMVYLFTILLPRVLIRTYRNYQGWTPIQMGVRERRAVPYVISILCYLLCYYLMNVNHMPHTASVLLIVAMLIQVSCAIINSFWKVSTHSAGIGGIAGALIAFSQIFVFNPTWWLCLVLLLAGLVGTSRMILRQHTLSQVVVGFLIGVGCGALIITL